MSKESMSLLEFQERFCDEKSCLAHLFRVRWPNGFACPCCGHQEFSYVSSRRLYQCSACRRQTSVTAGTVFHNTRTPIRKWFWMIFMMTRQKSGVSILRMQKLLKIGAYRTAWMMGHKIREAMVDRDSSYKRAGLIDLDNAPVGPKKPESSGKEAEGKARVMIGIERGGAKAGLRFLGRQESSSAELNQSMDEGGKEPNSESSSNSRTSHGRVESDRFSASYDDIRHPAQSLDKIRWVYAVIANIKGNIRGVHHGVSAKHLQRYLSEYIYRFNRRRRDSQLFNMALADCLSTTPVTQAYLIA